MAARRVSRRQLFTSAAALTASHAFGVEPPVGSAVDIETDVEMWERLVWKTAMEGVRHVYMSSTAAPGGDGSIARPYSSLLAALDAGGAEDGKDLTIELLPGDYSGEQIVLPEFSGTVTLRCAPRLLSEIIT